MRKIDKKHFFSSLVGEEYSKYQEIGIPQTSKESVVEFKVGKKYFYRIQNNPELILAHKKIHNTFLNSIPINNAATAFRANSSYLNFLEPHKSNYYFLRLDLKSFFHSITEQLLRESFEKYFIDEPVKQGVSIKLIDSFINLITYQIPNDSINDSFKGQKILPMGFKASPSISNIIFRKFDLLIQNFCSSNNVLYTRYADDMLFSSSSVSKLLHSDFFSNEISVLVASGGFKINQKKTVASEHTISLNGYIVEGSKDEGRVGTIRVSNKKTKIIDQLIYEIDKGTSNEDIMKKLFKFKVSEKTFKYHPPKREFVDKYCKDQIMHKLLGYRSYIISIVKFDQHYACINSKAIDKYQELITKLNKKVLECI